MSSRGCATAGSHWCSSRAAGTFLQLGAAEPSQLQLLEKPGNGCCCPENLLLEASWVCPRRKLSKDHRMARQALPSLPMKSPSCFFEFCGFWPHEDFAVRKSSQLWQRTAYGSKSLLNSPVTPFPCLGSSVKPLVTGQWHRCSCPAPGCEMEQNFISVGEALLGQQEKSPSRQEGRLVPAAPLCWPEQQRGSVCPAQVTQDPSAVTAPQADRNPPQLIPALCSAMLGTGFSWSLQDLDAFWLSCSTNSKNMIKYSVCKPTPFSFPLVIPGYSQ